MSTLPEIPPPCTDAANTDAMYDCIAAAYGAGDCATIEGMSAAATAAAACITARDDADDEA